MATNPLKIMDTILRDAHQSQAATRMRIEDMLPVCEKLDNMGYCSLECWGGATFDVCMRFLSTRTRGAAPAHAERGDAQNPICRCSARPELLGYKHYADDVVEQSAKVDRERHRRRPYLTR